MLFARSKPATRTEEKSTPLSLQQRLTRLCRRKVLLMLTDNARTMLSRRDEDGTLILRAHKMFLAAEEDVVQALAWWAQGKRRGEDLLQKFMDSNSGLVRAIDANARKVRIVTQGRFHDLQELAAGLNQTYLQNRSKAPVTWGRKVTVQDARRIRLGCYDPVRNFITLSQRLDRRDIPKYMVEYVLFHEMLHEVLGIGERADGKRDIHGRTFRLMEQTYPYYEEARNFERRKWGGE